MESSKLDAANAKIKELTDLLQIANARIHDLHQPYSMEYYQRRRAEALNRYKVEYERVNGKQDRVLNEDADVDEID